MTNYNPGDFKPAPAPQNYPPNGGYQQYSQPVNNMPMNNAPVNNYQNPVQNSAMNAFDQVFKYDSNGHEVTLTKEVIQNYIVGSDAKITDGEFLMFAELCRARKLNPFLKEAYIIKYGNNPAQLVVSKDVVLKRAALNPNYDGKKSGIIVKDLKTGNRKTIEGTCYDPEDEKLLGGWCITKRKDWTEPEYKSVSLHEVAKKKSNGELNGNWLTQPATMLEKVATVRCLREAFVEDFSGMYIEDEFDNTSNSVQNSPDPVAAAPDPMEQPPVIEASKPRSVSINDL